MAECDECIIDDEPWDCACYSHNEHGSDTHAKNPVFKGIEHVDVCAGKADHLLMWCTVEDCEVPRAWHDKQTHEECR